MEIEVGGEYRTNAGWRAVVLSKDAAGWHAVQHHVPGATYETRRHDLDGKCITNGMYDLVAPWKGVEPKGVEPKGEGMEIEVGDVCKSRVGWRAVVLNKNAGGWFEVQHHVPGRGRVMKSHSSRGTHVSDNNYDLIAPWKAGDTRPAPRKGVEPKAATSNKGAPTVAISLGAGGWDVRCSGLTPEQVAAIVRHI